MLHGELWGNEIALTSVTIGRQVNPNADLIMPQPTQITFAIQA